MKFYLKLLFFLIFSPLCVFAYVPKDVLLKYNSELLLELGIVGRPQWDVTTATNGTYSHYIGIGNHRLSIQHIQETIQDYLNFFNFSINDTLNRVSFIYDKDLLNAFQTAINAINSSVTFVLHSKFPHPSDKHKNTLLQELKMIENCGISDAIVIIDNIHLSGTELFDNIATAQIHEALIKINPDFIFSYERGGLLGLEDKACLVAYSSRRR
jgi:hypothetical protein